MASQKKANGQATRKSSQVSSSLPLFFKNPHPLNPERHAGAGLNSLKDFGYARHANSVPLNLVEFFEAARSYPIVFTKNEQPVPVALLGIREENYFLDGAGQWREQCYIPAYVRRYPFIFMEDAEAQRFILCVDEDAPHYAASEPAMPFYVEGAAEPAELTQNALKFCALYQQHHQQTIELGAALKQEGLLIEKLSTLRLPDGREERLSGFYILDSDRFTQLPEELFLAWRKKGWIALIDAILISYTNWKYLGALAGKR